MNTALDHSFILRWLAERIVCPQFAVVATVLTGTLGVRHMRARRFPDGVTVALTLERGPQQAAEACLLLAATPEARDDALYLADNQLWLLRRYPTALAETELDLLFKQQQALAALLLVTDQGGATPLPIAGRYV
ncbi:protein EsaB [Burkholderia lata]|uniref:protein EsaB n=1 Tax=Burkholderia lata (strain ATCC 17760 / DSM 23089 / LMG 22485 / NCIMB 9086 / R18194 / 383) TaxID=482957 RepID=UPI00158264C2|nr:protein EsaB [Burkholderia lata]